MAQDLTGKYLLKNTEGGMYVPADELFTGLRILKVDGLISKGKPVNVYTAQWVDNQTEDFLITTTDRNNNPVVIRENQDIEITFIIHSKYGRGVDVGATHDGFISFMTSSDVWVQSAFVNKSVHCVCLKEYKPTTVKLQRGDASWVMGTITMHALEAPS